MHKSWQERLWERVDKSGGPNACWSWGGHRAPKLGHGLLSVNGRNRCAHRLVYEILVGPIPDGLFLLHECDNPPCCNPAHLHPGTHRKNMAEMVARGRSHHQRGEANGNVKLTREQVLEIRALYRQGGLLQRELAAQFGVTQMMISRIVRGAAWPDA